MKARKHTMKPKILLPAVLLLVLCTALCGCSLPFGSKSKAYSFKLDTGDEIVVSLSGADGYRLTSDGTQFSVENKSKSPVLTSNWLKYNWDDVLNEGEESDVGIVLLGDNTFCVEHNDGYQYITRLTEEMIVMMEADHKVDDVIKGLKFSVNGNDVLPSAGLAAYPSDDIGKKDGDLFGKRKDDSATMELISSSSEEEIADTDPSIDLSSSSMSVDAEAMIGEDPLSWNLPEITDESVAAESSVSAVPEEPAEAPAGKPSGDGIVGTYRAGYDMRDMINMQGEALGITLTTPVDATFIIELAEDGTYSLYADSEGLVDSVRSALSVDLPEIIKAKLADQGITEDKYDMVAAANGFGSFDEFVASKVEAAASQMSTTWSSLQFGGTYEAGNGTLTLEGIGESASQAEILEDGSIHVAESLGDASIDLTFYKD